MQPFRRSLGRFECQRLDGVCLEEFPGSLPFLGLLANSCARGHHKQGEVIAPAIFAFENVVAETEPVFAGLPGEPERD